MKIMYNINGDYMITYENCNLCPHNCNINRNIYTGYCKATSKIKIAKYCLYMYEEPSISGTNGSGTVFFSCCNMRCIYCQNYEISENCKGKEITEETLAEIFLTLQKKNAHNINLVTPTPYIIGIKKAIILAKEKGLTIPIVYNTSSYENPEALKELNGLIDIYLPDLKYYNDEYAEKYSNCKNYFKIATLAIQEMYNQVGNPVFDENGILKKGIIIRHLMLPTLKQDTKEIINYIYKTYKNNVIISIMNQYTPIKTYKYKELNTKIKETDYDEIINYAYDLGIRKAYIQEEGTVDTSFIPDWDI